MTEQLTADRARYALNYDPETGQFTWKNPSSTNVRAGDKAGYVKRNGYVQICVDGTRYLAHRLAWLMVYGHWPKIFIDHINRSRADNRIANLRDVCQSKNMLNANLRPKTGMPHGVTRPPPGRKKYRAAVEVYGRKVHVGYFDTPEAAHIAYMAARTELAA